MSLPNFTDAQQIEDRIEKQDRNACNTCEGVRDWLRTRNHLWLVTVKGYQAVVRAPHETGALNSCGFKGDLSSATLGATVICLDPDALNLPYEDAKQPHVIIAKGER